MLFIDWLVFDLIAYEAVIVDLSITFYLNLVPIATLPKLSQLINILRKARKKPTGLQFVENDD